MFKTLDRDASGKIDLNLLQSLYLRRTTSRWSRIADRGLFGSRSLQLGEWASLLHVCDASLGCSTGIVAA
ncbi:hypothetical protein SKAU_G00179910 [Synaphobranchus kaupii]|uniref:EF-hand domain-containing protein n=1 Tax=Synaphobranchus kaupii TaxID=118154 RepID=A0A9Q1FM97_SYNKA|nr:hypothetical protein SKAU_G00179910 [Synaphobranchus kaupii]